MGQTTEVPMWMMWLACAEPEAEKTEQETFATCDEELTLPEATPDWEDVAPILGEHCTRCHQDGGIAPFALQSPETVAAWASAIQRVVLDRSMPPFLPSTCGDCQTWRDANVLSADEIATLVAWADGGKPTGGSAVPVGDVPGLDRIDLTVDIGEPYTPDASVSDDYRCFVIDAPNSGYITGFDVHPGDARVVHHVIVYDPDDLEAADALDAADDGPGYACSGGPGVDANTLAAWAPGGGAVNFPEGTGIQTNSNRLVVQMHYNLANGAWPDLTTIDFSTEAEVDSPAAIYRLAQTDLALEPGQPEVERHISMTIGGDAQVWGLVSHMHNRGLATGVTLSHDGADTCMLNIPRWDFGWQQFWFYEEPLPVYKDDVLTLSCTFDTSGDDQVVDWGENTTDEMCVAFAYVTL